jgi:superfamily II DNA or RNA helicase
MLSVETARSFLDMGRRVGEETGRSQLEAAVAIYNLLERHRVAYLADEVGMGKTYVALGALALLRHFKPRSRLLVLAPRENIQKKWMKELRTFTEVCVRYPDLRVKAIQGTPARGLVSCSNLVELVREVTIDPDRDFFARLTSFSFGLGSDTASWKDTRDRFLEYLPAEDADSFDLRDKTAFKDAIGRALARALPRFDLVIVDEAHNLKAGFQPDRKTQASRNRILGLALGPHSDGLQTSLRAQRLLMLSATPVDDDYRQLWNQLEMFGHARGVPELKNEKLPDEERRAAAKRILIRRVTALDCAGGRLTKTEYRREWRRGGVEEHDTAARIDDSQKLTVALVQKKVGEVLNSSRFNASFQIGMLASFESFLETRGIRRAGDEEGLGHFDDAEQTDDPELRAGVDVDVVNKLARDYRRRLGDRELPHPKMDGLVSHLGHAFGSGHKALVFVRRVASVRELKRKLERLYDDYLIARLRRELLPKLQTELDAQVAAYQRTREERSARNESVIPSSSDLDVEDEVTVESEGGTETFFAWFFRGDGPAGIFSGANFQKRFLQKRTAVATVFEDNHLAWLLEVEPGGVLAGMSNRLARPQEALVSELRRLAAHYNSDAKPTRRGQFLAWQGAGLELLKGCDDATFAERAAHVWVERYQSHRSTRPRGHLPNEPSWLEESTFFTELRRRPVLCRALWPQPRDGSFEQKFREQELRRELLATMVRLGHAFIDLYVLAANQLGSLKGGARPTDESGRELTAKFLDLLDAQCSRPSEWRAFQELADAEATFDAIVDANLPEVRQQPLASVARDLGVLLTTQQPVGGMAGGINQRLVRQFRMPGYPCVLVTTDVLQEGEDLHLFCSRVYHYGLSWTPSSMEQRVGRIDRVRSKTHRQLETLSERPNGDEKLQVFYPHLRETAEAYQVQTVLERLNRFLVLMHKDLKAPELDQRQLNIRDEVARGLRDVPAITASLTSAFPVPDEYLGTTHRQLDAGPEVAERIGAQFAAAATALQGALKITWIEERVGVRVGVLKSDDREQAFTLFLRSVDGWPCIRCISPIGTRDCGLTAKDISNAVLERGVRISVVYNQAVLAYEFAIEGDVLLWPGSDATSRIETLVKAVTYAADNAEARLLEVDAAVDDVKGDLSEEPQYER